MSKRKLLFIPYTCSLRGGAEKILINIVGQISEKYDIDVLEYSYYGASDIEKMNVKCLSPVINRTKWWGKIIEFGMKFISLIPLLGKIHWFVFYNSEKNIDIAISFNYQDPSFMLLNIPSISKIAWIHGSIEDLDFHRNRGLKRLKTFIRYLAQRKVLEKVNKAVVVSKLTYESVLKLYPFVADKLLIINNGMDIEVIREKSDEFFVEKSLEFSLVYVGRLDSNKNVSFLIEVFARLKNHCDNVRLLIIGDGEQRPTLEHLVEKMSLNQSVTFLGYCTNPYPYIKKSDLLCLTSYSEGFPTVVLESMALGVPFISTPVGGVDELSNNGKCGVVAEMKVDVFTSEIMKFVKEPLFESDFRKECFEYINNYTLRDQIRKVEMLIDEL